MVESFSHHDNCKLSYWCWGCGGHRRRINKIHVKNQYNLQNKRFRTRGKLSTQLQINKERQFGKNPPPSHRKRGLRGTRSPPAIYNLKNSAAFRINKFGPGWKRCVFQVAELADFHWEHVILLLLFVVRAHEPRISRISSLKHSHARRSGSMTKHMAPIWHMDIVF